MYKIIICLSVRPTMSQQHHTSHSNSVTEYRLKIPGKPLLLYRAIIWYNKTHNSSIRSFRMMASGAAIAAIPICRESGSTPVNSMHCY